MAGPGIRAYHFARELARENDVTLVAPAPSAIDVDGVELRRPDELAGSGRSRFRDFDAIVAQRLGVATMRALAREDVKVIYDLYVPSLVENLGFYAEDPRSERYRWEAYRATNLRERVALLTGDAFICASERQRDLWLGLLLGLGRVTPSAYADDPTLRGLIDVVPFGLEEQPPQSSERLLKGVVPGIRETDRVLIWGGGVWNWFDPLTPIRAVHELSRRRDDVKLFFLGGSHPDAGSEEMAMSDRGKALARELEIEGRFVFFNTDWVPYGRRGSYLLEADLGVSAHLETAETRFAFRTRLLDYLWAGLPVVTTRGDVLGDLVDERGLGRTTESGDVEGWLMAIETLLDDAAEMKRARAAVASTRSEFHWRRVVEPLGRLVASPRGGMVSQESAASAIARYVSLGIRSSVRDRGYLGTVRHAARVLRRSRLP
jgi:glycosyltransferase involved in cell wall biosynthesis